MGVFALSVIVAAAFAYLPGFFYLKALRLPWLFSAVTAPLVSIAIYVPLCVVLGRLGVFTTWTKTFIPVLVVGVICFGVSYFVERHKLSAQTLDEGKHDAGFKERFSLPVLSAKRPQLFDILCLGLFIAVSALLTLYIFLQVLPNPASINQLYDNVHHMAETQAFVTSGNWSSIDVTLYGDERAQAINPLPGTSFYPSAWNILCAMIITLFEVSEGFATNTMTVLVLVVILPSNLYLLLRYLFAKKPVIIICGAVIPLAFVAFPWQFIFFGPLYPNMLGFSMIFSAAVLFMMLFRPAMAAAERLVGVVVLVVFLFALAMAHPNAVFTLAVFLMPYCVYQAGIIYDRTAKQRENKQSSHDVLSGQRRWRKVGVCAATGLVLVGIWAATLSVPMLQEVLSYDEWPGVLSAHQALADILLLRFRAAFDQIPLMILLIIGVFYTLHRREYLWITISYALMCTLFYIAGVANGPAKAYFVGFWYGDYVRLAASAVLFAMPLVTVGLWVIVSFINTVMRQVTGRSARGAVLVLTCISLAVVNYFPSVRINDDTFAATAFGWLQWKLTNIYGSSPPSIYDVDEQEFVDQVKKIVGQDDLILNNPTDGSTFALVEDDLNLYYRYLNSYGESYETSQSRAIRDRLDAVATDEDVQQAVDDIGAKYLLLLDSGVPLEYTYSENGVDADAVIYDTASGTPIEIDRTDVDYGELGLENDYDARIFLASKFISGDFPAFYRITEETPGFELVLSQGDMRLYRIE